MPVPDFPPALQPLRVLYAEDHAPLRELMTLTLHHEGHQIETVADGREALLQLNNPEAAFDLLITDHHMPHVNGLEVVRQCRQLGFRGRIIVFSSEISPLVHDEYRQLAVDLLLPKPIFPATFRRLLRELFAPHYPAPRTPATPNLNLALA
jgi:two-component system chemotaxis response regulator CheY